MALEGGDPLRFPSIKISKDKLISAAHPKGERCNFALKRFLGEETGKNTLLNRPGPERKRFYSKQLFSGANC